MATLTNHMTSIQTAIHAAIDDGYSVYFDVEYSGFESGKIVCLTLEIENPEDVSDGWAVVYAEDRD